MRRRKQAGSWGSCDDCDAQKVTVGHPLGRRRLVCMRCSEKYSDAAILARIDREILLEQLRQGHFELVDLREGKEGTNAIEGTEGA